MSTEPTLMCGADPGDPDALYYLERAFDASGEAHVYQGRGPSRGGPQVVVRVWKPFGERPAERQFQAWQTGVEILDRLADVEGVCRATANFTGPRPWYEGQTPTGERVPVQVLAYIPGENLQQRLRPGSAMAARDGLLDGTRVLHRLARVLGELDRRGIVHRDIHPSNLMIAESGDVVLIDFSTARPQQALTEVIGRRGFMAPETGELTTARDIHGFGGVAFFLLTGNSPMLGNRAVLDDVEMPDPLRRHLDLVLNRRPEHRLPAAALPTWVDNLATIVSTTAHATPAVTWPPCPPAPTQQPSEPPTFPPPTFPPPAYASPTPAPPASARATSAPPASARATTAPPASASPTSAPATFAPAVLSQPTPPQSAPSQPAPWQPAASEPPASQPASPQPAPSQLDPSQAAPCQPVSPHLAPSSQLTPPQPAPSTHPTPSESGFPHPASPHAAPPQPSSSHAAPSQSASFRGVAPQPGLPQPASARFTPPQPAPSPSFPAVLVEPTFPAAEVATSTDLEWLTLTALSALVTAAPVVPPARTAPPGTRPVLLPPEPNRTPGRAAVPGPRPRPDLPRTEVWATTSEPPAPVSSPPPASVPLERTRVAPPPTDPAPAMAEPGWERYLFGVEVVAVPALAALAAWLVWLIAEGEVTGADGYGSFVLVIGVATVAGLIGRWMGAPAQRRWPKLANSIWWWRALHAPAGLAFVVAIVVYAILLQPPGSP